MHQKAVGKLEDFALSKPMRSRMEHAALMAVIFGGIVALIAALHFSRTIMAPIFLAVVIGVMFGPIADRIERNRIKPSISAGIVVIIFMMLIMAAITAFAVPLSKWIDELPVIWSRLRFELTSFQNSLDSISSVQAQIQELAGTKVDTTVVVNDGSAVTDAAYLAPTIVGQIALFLASFYFFVATRHDLRRAILSLCLRRRTRWHVAKVFREIEQNVSKYLLAITIINVIMGLSVSLALWSLGIPSPLLWGMIAAVLNYVVFIGPAITFMVLLGVGLASTSTLGSALLPALIYVGINFIEAQFVTPSIIGRSVTMNPFIVFLAIVFWIWLWGPLGGFIAIPALLMIFAIYNQMFAKPAERRREAA